jgi:hypothetical protein
VHKRVKYKRVGFNDIRALSFLAGTFKVSYDALEQTGTIDAMCASWFAFGWLGG